MGTKRDALMPLSQAAAPGQKSVPFQSVGVRLPAAQRCSKMMIQVSILLSVDVIRASGEENEG